MIYNPDWPDITPALFGFDCEIRNLAMGSIARFEEGRASFVLPEEEYIARSTDVDENGSLTQAGLDDSISALLERLKQDRAQLPEGRTIVWTRGFRAIRLHKDEGQGFHVVLYCSTLVVDSDGHHHCAMSCHIGGKRVMQSKRLWLEEVTP